MGTAESEKFGGDAVCSLGRLDNRVSNVRIGIELFGRSSSRKTNAEISMTLGIHIGAVDDPVGSLVQRWDEVTARDGMMFPQSAWDQISDEVGKASQAAAHGSPRAATSRRAVPCMNSCKACNSPSKRRST